MSNKKFSRPSLALFTAIALSGGAFFAPSFASGADVTIDSTHPPQRNVPNPDDPSTPNSAASVGTGSEDASGNSLTVDRYQEDTLSVFGGVARGTGNADGNTVRIKGATTEIASVYGGAAWGTGHARENRVRFDAGTMSFAEWLVGGYVGRSGRAEENTVEVNGGKAESLYGGFSNSTNATGRIHKNHVVIRGGTIAGKVYGGVFGGAHATGDVTHNTVTITGGTLKKAVCGGSLEKADSTGNVAYNEVTVAGGVFRGDVYGGYTRRGGALTGNIVTITGGELNSVYAAYSAGNVSEIKGNVVNLGDGKNEMKAGYRIAKYIFGASGGDRAAYADNTLNVKASARAKNIVNFDKVNFYFTDTLQPRLTLRDSTGTKFKSLKDIAIYGSPSTPAGTLIENNTSGGIVVRDGVNAVVRTGDTAEVTLEKDATGRKILYSRLIFKGATTAESEGTHIWGGRSAIGNTTTGNDVALASGSYVNAFGGWTTGAGSDAAADKLGDSTGNKITVTGTANVTGTVYGGYTDAASGKARGNTVTIESAVHDVVGGEGAGEASGNTVDIRANAAAVTGGRGAAANGNIVNLGNVTVTSVTGGEGVTTNNNEVHLNGNVRVTGALKGGSQASGMGNTLSVKGKGNKAGAITGFQKLTFDAAGLAKDDTMLEVTGTGETAVDWASLTATGTAVKPLTLLKNEQGIRLAHYTGAAKSETGDEAETNIDVRKSGARITAITYEGYRFKGATQATREGRDAYGGRSKAGNSTRENEIALASGTYANVYGGWTSGVGTTAAEKGASYENKVKISGTATVTGTVYGGYTDAAGGKARGNAVTIESAVHDVVGGEGAGEASGNTVDIRANAAAVTGGRSMGAASNNRVTLGNITATSVVGGDAAATAEGNTVSLDGTIVTNDVTGGRGAAANGNVVSLSNTHVNGAIMGGYGTAQSDGNTVSLQNTAVNGAVTGGYGTATNGNTIHLRNTVVNGIVTGGTASGGVGNTLSVYYSAGTSSIHDFKGIEDLRFDVEDAPTDGTAHTLLKLTNVSGGSKNLTNMTLDFRRSGAARKLQAGDSFTLLENTSGKITVGEGVTMKGTDGIAHDCLFAIAPDQAHPEKLRATVTKTGVGETAKSPVETRAGLANFVNQGADYLVESGFTAAEMSAESGAENASADDTAESSAKDTQRRTAASDLASYHLWAGAGANAMRVESGSHVDSKGWNLGVGWAREDAAKGGTKRLFSPFVEYGRGTYDSYLDNGAHGSGKFSYLGLGVLGKLTQQDGLWLEASARAGRAKSDYSLHGENAGYDGSNTYYGIHLGVGKTFALQESASLDAYVRYFWSHQDGMSVKLRGSGDAYDFADVDSHRLRLGLRYSRKDRSAGECYAGLAWEHELGGEASASVGGDAAPSPSLKGSSYMLELGYRFLPQNSRISYDFHINGWQGKRKGLSGGAAIQWTF
ncbi:autotransporter outer membrane beta-barrel domain-containing protein [uncultured Selenomonas sp.]|uniref:autotransporter outer membrane beta-barrel domain-containing protein n=2 Tax=uncultured Selenomonas sp. TaxID=159275 RepID=UPI0028D1CF5F|nr:autotransporter outer membrane beta-barrel domain-containing protein [uncultured Selenomonas sp.]